MKRDISTNARYKGRWKARFPTPSLSLASTNVEKPHAFTNIKTTKNNLEINLNGIYRHLERM